MRNDERDVVALEAVSLHQVDGQIGHSTHCVLENLRTFLMHVVHLFLDSFYGGRVQRSAARHEEELSAGAVYIMFEIEDAFVLSCRFDQRSARAVAEEDARRAVLVVQN